MQSDKHKKYAEEIRKHGLDGIIKIAQILLDNPDNFTKAGMKADKESIEEILIMLVSDQFRGLMQDVIFGEMRCYALQGNYRMLTKSSEELREFAKNPENQPAPVITESAIIIGYDAEKNKTLDDLTCTPFISDSPPIVLEAVESIKEAFGKVSSKLWKPGDKVKPLATLLP